MRTANFSVALLLLDRDSDYDAVVDEVQFRAGLVAGTDEAFLELGRRYNDSMFRTCRRVLRNASLAEDAVQDALMRAFEKREQLAAAANLKGYLLALAHNIAIDRVRKQKRRTELDREHGDHDGELATADAEIRDDRRRIALAECISALDPITRDLVLAHADGEDSWETVGAPAKLTADAARMRFSRGLKALKACLGKKGVSS